MPIPRIRKFCGCFDLLLGGKILGLYGFLLGIGYVMYTVGVVKDVDHFEKEQKEHEFFNDNHTAIYVIFSINAIVGTFLWITSLFSLYGSVQEVSKYVLPFLIGLVVSALWAFVFMTIEIIDTSYVEAVYLGLLAVLQFYFFLCAYAFYKNLQDIELVSNLQQIA